MVTENGKAMKRYNLNLPLEVATGIETAAEARGTSTQELIRRFILLGLTALELEKAPEDAMIIRRSGVDKYVTFF